MGSLSIWHWIIVVVVVLLLFGRGKISELMGDMAQGIKAFKKGPAEICTVFGPTCDALDVISMSEELPATLERGDLVYSKHIGAYSVASATHFNGFSPARIVHINQ